jgi:gas vesicle protein
MEYDREHHVYSFVSGLLLGAVIGAGVALLAAPDSGRRTRRRLRKAAVGVKDTATDQWEEISSDVKEKVDDALKIARSRFTG